jgi:hypothetical protein
VSGIRTETPPGSGSTDWPAHSRWRLRRQSQKVIGTGSRAEAALDVLAVQLAATSPGLLGRWVNRRRIRRVRRILKRHQASWQHLADECGAVLRLATVGTSEARIILASILGRRKGKPCEWLQSVPPVDESLLPVLRALDVQHPVALERQLKALLSKSTPDSD